MHIYLRHPRHGTKVAVAEAEALYDEKNGWERFDPYETPPAPPAFEPPPPPAEVVASPVEAEIVSRRRPRESIWR